MGEEDVTSLVLGKEGFVERISFAEFQNVINDDGWSSEQHYGYGWVCWRDEASSSSSPSEKFKCVLRNFVKSFLPWSSDSFLVQFWAPSVVGGTCYLKTSDQPFAIYGCLSKRLCWYRKYCMDSGLKIYVGVGAKEEQLGPIGRVFRNEQPESSPDLRLYSATDHPFRDQAAHDCGVRVYYALPVFDLHLNQCLGVLELVSGHHDRYYFEYLEQALKEANQRSTHINLRQLMKNPKYQTEFGKMLDTAIDAVPQLHLAQVWVPCKECYNTGNNLSCMERAAFISATGNVNSYDIFDEDELICAFLVSSEFHRVQSQKGVAGIVLSSKIKSCFCRNISDLTISEYPLAHYARQARLSFCFAIYLQSVHNKGEFCILEFFLQCPQSRKDVSAQSVLHLLFQIINEKLPSYKMASGQQLPQELVVRVGTKNKVVSCGLSQPKMSPYMTVSTLIGCDKGDTTFNNTLELDSLSSLERSDGDIIYWERKELLDAIEEDIKLILRKIMSILKGKCDLVQFWALKRIGDSCYLKTRDQPFDVSSIFAEKYLFYREQCMKHEYFVGEGAKEEEIGPPGRVFRNRFPEFTPDLRLYSTEEFPLRDTAAHCSLRNYLALPIFDHEQCIGVLEFFGLSGTHLPWSQIFRCLTDSLEETTSLKSTHIYDTPRPRWKAIEKTTRTEIKRMLKVVRNAPELCLIEVWVPFGQCDSIDDNPSCVEQVLCDWEYDWMSFEMCKVQIGKGIAGTVLAAESKSCLFPSLCDFSITEEPRAHIAELNRLNVCFVVCLQSAYTGNTQYIIEFFLDPSYRNYEQFCPFLHFLLSIMKDELKSFKFASGNQIGDELVVEVIKFGEDCEYFTPFESHQPIDKFPFRFKVLSYGKQMEHDAYEEIEHQVSQESEHQHTFEEMEHQVGQGTEHQHTFEEIEQQVDSGRNALEATEESKKERDKTSFNISYEVLQQHLGKKIDDVIKELGVSRSTFKRIIRSHGITRWPCNVKNKKNPSIFEASNANKRVRGNQQETLVSSSNIPPCFGQNVLINTDTIGSSQYHIDLPKTDDVVTIKAKFGDDTMKIQFCKSSKMEKLIEEVVRRFNLRVGSFKLKYFDEDDEWMLLACDDDLKLCIKTFTSLGKTPIRVSVQSI